jgi:hypothetical protein
MTTEDEVFFVNMSDDHGNGNAEKEGEAKSNPG